MRLQLAAAAAALLLGPLSVSAQSLLGDTLTFLRAYPSPSTPYTTWNPVQVSTTVTADDTDRITWASGSAPLTIDTAADRITFTFLSSTSYISGGSVFDGFVITGFSHDIRSASVLSQAVPGTVSLDVQPRQLNLGIHSSTLTGQSIVLSVSMVPEPGTWALMLAGVAALGALARRRSTQA